MEERGIKWKSKEFGLNLLILNDGLVWGVTSFWVRQIFGTVFRVSLQTTTTVDNETQLQLSIWQISSLWLSTWALEQDHLSWHCNSTIYHLGEFGLQFSVLQKDLIHKTVVRFKGIGVSTHSHRKYIEQFLADSKYSMIWVVTIVYYFVGHEPQKAPGKCIKSYNKWPSWARNIVLSLVSNPQGKPSNRGVSSAWSL